MKRDVENLKELHFLSNLNIKDNPICQNEKGLDELIIGWIPLIEILNLENTFYGMWRRKVPKKRKSEILNAFKEGNIIDPTFSQSFLEYIVSLQTKNAPLKKFENSLLIKLTKEMKQKARPKKNETEINKKSSNQKKIIPNESPQKNKQKEPINKNLPTNQREESSKKRKETKKKENRFDLESKKRKLVSAEDLNQDAPKNQSSMDPIQTSQSGVLNIKKENRRGVLAQASKLDSFLHKKNKFASWN